jgi:monoamine oxidase
LITAELCDMIPIIHLYSIKFKQVKTMTRYDTLIIGAGAAGLAAGCRLQAAGQTILLLEARNRIGGRIWTVHDFADFPVEQGAQLIHGESAVTHQLVQAAGFQTLPAPRKAFLQWGGPTGLQHIADLPPELRTVVDALFAAYQALPEKLPAGADFSLADYFRGQGFDATAIGADVLFAQTCCASIETLSCATTAPTCRSGWAAQSRTFVGALKV